ncbi:hypothetical protein MK786_01085 [Microbacterium sp. CFH 31415]|uniref:hypothetical protein n=1 Tax=Microbacterium sp. CFH 31415 TaxID=2921732 RepID=UPI001F13B0CE|nr:hypothetical protein [Microbacterium sp. CFH 31415]MCH6229333.1 hypothetical protein [Microbacterium sp. CFH 31415]
MTDTSNFANVDIAAFDQTLAEYGDADALCPQGTNRKLLRLAPIRAAIKNALRSADYDSVGGTVPVIQLTGGFTQAIRERVGEEPAGRKSTVTYCAYCGDPTGFTTPFWVNCGTVIAQVDLCNACTKHAMDDLDCKPQIGSPGRAD